MAKRSSKTGPTSYRMTPGKPAPKSSQGGYGHASPAGGRVVVQGSRTKGARKRRGGA